METSDQSEDDFTEESNDDFPAWENDVRLFVQAVNSAEQRTEHPATMLANQDEGASSHEISRGVFKYVDMCSGHGFV